ncbi:MAG: flagellar basal-body rod protein FlgF [Desulfatitalea sp.]|nr:flagellar basal-body rod protein FlgF [Desulfatitalea sp.]
MSGTIYQAAAGALLQQMRMDMLSNNLANVNTSGFKADHPTFRIPNEEMPAPPLMEPGRLSPYAPPMEARTDFSGGALTRTGSPLDVAIAGKGFFEVQTPEGNKFTRKGHFAINQQGVLSTPEGWPVLGQGGEIAIDGSRIEIDDHGEVFVDGEAVGVLQVVDFPEPYNLTKQGDTLFVPAQGQEGQPVDPGDTRLVQGHLEASNVDPIRTMTEIIETMRVFEAYQRIIRTADEATAKTVSEVGRSS